jgi:hypothetical protein
LKNKPLSCKYNQECWLKVRLPIIRKEGIYLPYQCSYVAEGDLYNCSWRKKFAEQHGDILEDEEGEKIFYGELSTNRISRDDF